MTALVSFDLRKAGRHLGQAAHHRGAALDPARRETQGVGVRLAAVQEHGVEGTDIVGAHPFLAREVDAVIDLLHEEVQEQREGEDEDGADEEEFLRIAQVVHPPAEQGKGPDTRAAGIGDGRHAFPRSSVEFMDSSALFESIPDIENARASPSRSGKDTSGDPEGLLRDPRLAVGSYSLFRVIVLLVAFGKMGGQRAIIRGASS